MLCVVRRVGSNSSQCASLASDTMGRSMARTAHAPNKSSTNKWDLEIAKVENKTALWQVFAYGVVVALCVAASALPLWMMHGIIQPLAGKTTNVSLNVPISIGLGLSVVVNIGQHIKGRSRKSELKRQRERAEKYEVDLGVTL
jgi:hypothetical protein